MKIKSDAMLDFIKQVTAKKTMFGKITIYDYDNSTKHLHKFSGLEIRDFIRMFGDRLGSGYFPYEISVRPDGKGFDVFFDVKDDVEILGVMFEM